MLFVVHKLPNLMLAATVAYLFISLENQYLNIPQNIMRAYRNI